MFSGYFMGKFMRGKVEDHILAEKKDNKVKFEEEVVVPEKDETYTPNQKDHHILELEERTDYQQFLQESRKLVSDQSVRGDLIRRFVHRTSPTSLVIPSQLYEVLMMVFDLKGSVTATNIDNRGIFYNLAPSSLINYLKDAVREEKEIAENSYTDRPDPQIPSPEEAEEAGKFMAEQDEDYGPDWMWLANNLNWYKKSSLNRRNWYKRSQQTMIVPGTLYHATYRVNLPKIQESGGILPSGNLVKCWPDCPSGVYLHRDSDVAYSYPEAADTQEIQGEWYEDIVVLKIDTTNLNTEAFEYDPNLLPPLNEDSYVYHGTIPVSAVKAII